MMRMETQLICKPKADTENTLVSAYFIGKDGNKTGIYGCIHTPWK